MCVLQGSTRIPRVWTSSPLLSSCVSLRASRSAVGCASLFFKIKIQCTQSEFGARSPHSSRGDREKGQKKSGQWRHLSTAIAAVPGTEKAKKKLMYSGAPRPGVLTSRGSLRCCDTDRVHCRPPLRWPNSLQRLACWDPKFDGAPRVGEPTCNLGCCAHSLP